MTARRARVLATVALVTVLLNAAVVGGVLGLQGTETELQRSHDVKAAINGLVAGMSEMEAGLIAYVAKRDAGFLELFGRSEHAGPERLSHLESIAAGIPDGGDLTQFVTGSRSHLDVLSRMRDAARAAGAVPPHLVTAAGRERDRVLASAGRLIRREDQRLAVNGSRVRLLRMRVLWAAGAAALGALACAALALKPVRRGPRASAPAPITEPPSDETAVTLAASAAGSPAAASVLIVDDDRHVRELLRRWLQPHVRELREAEDARSALAALADGPPDVLVCDIHMPGKDGLWLAERVRERAPNTAIVLATGDDAVPPFESFKPGVVGYVLKPFRREQLLAAVREGTRWAAQSASAPRARGRQPIDVGELA
jgi:CheY-like chemotaxis protein